MEAWAFLFICRSAALVQIDLRLWPQLSSAHLMVEVVNAHGNFVLFNPDNLADRLPRNSVSLCQILDRVACLKRRKNFAISHLCFVNHRAGAPRFAEQAYLNVTFFQ
jgi:hypothetical protein